MTSQVVQERRDSPWTVKSVNMDFALGLLFNMDLE